MQHVSTCFPNEPMVNLAEKLAQITPGALKKSYFTNSGTEANETAIQVARMHTGNFEVVALRHGYSGRSSLTRGLTGMNTWRKGHDRSWHRACHESVLLSLPSGTEISRVRSGLRERY